MTAYPADGSLRISPKFTAIDWTTLYRDNPRDWPRAVEILQDRLNGRFIGFADMMLDQSEHSGFAALAIDALVIEALQQFKEGRPSKRASQAMFTRFLTEEFPADFPDQGRAADFYEFVRNGILHAAETRGDVLVRRRGTQAIAPAPTGSGFEVNPKVFHKNVKAAFANYCARLVAADQDALRVALWNRMEVICATRTKRSHIFVSETRV